jgi:hypothetical protein
MTPPSNLRWETPGSPVMAHLRILTDGITRFLIADFTNPPAPPGYPASVWLFSHVTHGVVGPEGTTRLRLPAIGLTDGRGRISVRLAILATERWDDLRGAALPPIVEPGRQINFPPLPTDPLPYI